jgi:hypothetical protein
VLASLTFVTPLGGLLALAAIVPIAAFAVSAMQAARGRALLGLAAPAQDRHVAFAALAAVPLLLGLAAAEPALRSHVTRHIRTDAQAIFVFDTSRSMAASSGRGAPTRFARAQEAAIRLRNDAIPDVPSGVSTLTTQLLPHLFPTPDAAVFDSTVTNAIGIEKPPPPALELGLTGTAFSALGPIRDQGFFDPATKKRLVILLTDGESGPYEPAPLAETLAGKGGTSASSFGDSGQSQAPVTLVIIRIGGSSERIYYGDGSIEAAYRPDPRAPNIVSTLASLSRGFAFKGTQLSAAGRALRSVLGPGKTKAQGERTKTVVVAPYAALAALAALAVVIWKRNLISL